MPRARGGRRGDPRHRPRDDDGHGHGPAARSRAPTCAGLDDVLAALSRAEEEWGEHFAPPLLLRRLVAQGRLGAKTRSGLLPLPAARRAATRTPRSSSRPAARSRSRGWTTRPRTRLAARWSTSCAAVWDVVEAAPEVRALIIASPNPALFCAGADIRAFTEWEPAAGEDAPALGPRAAAQLRALADDDDRGRQRPRVRRRVRARDGLRRAPRRLLGELRPARDRPRDHARPRRHAAPAAAGRPGQGARDEHDRRGGLGRGRLRARARQPRGGRPRAVRRRAAVGAQVSRGQAPIAARADQARLRTRATSTTASRPSSRPSATVFATEDAREGIGAFLGKRRPEVPRDVTPERHRSRPPRRADPRARLGRRAHGGGDLGAVRDPRLPLAPDRPVAQRRPDGGRPHRRVPARPGALLDASTGSASRCCATSGPTARTPRS